jgi:hypothetical protein
MEVAMRMWCVLVLTLGCLAVRTEAGQAQEAVQVIVEKAIRAHGGQARIERSRARETRNKGTFSVAGQELPFTQDVSYEWPNRFKGVLELQTAAGPATAVTVFDGLHAWRSIQAQTQELDGTALEEVKEETYVTQLIRLTNLRSPGLQLAPGGEATVAGRPAVAVKVSSPGHRDVTLYFDRESGLLVETQRHAVDVKTTKEYLEEKVFTDYRVTDGLPWPRRVTIYRDGQKFIDAETVSVRYLEKMDAGVFAKP